MIMQASVVHIIVQREKTFEPKQLTALIARNVNRPVIGDSCDLYMAALAIEDAVCTEVAGLDSKAVLCMSHVTVAFVFHVLGSVGLWQPPANLPVVGSMAAVIYPFQTCMGN